jgi:hypothetical protein
LCARRRGFRAPQYARSAIDHHADDAGRAQCCDDRDSCDHNRAHQRINTFYGAIFLDGEVFPVPDPGFGRSDDALGAAIGLRAVGLALESGDPGEQRLQTDTYQVRQV